LCHVRRNLYLHRPCKNGLRYTNSGSMKSRKELKEAYKLLKFPMGVYQIRNTTNGKIFIGSSMNLNAVWNSQKFQLEMETHRNPAMQKDWNEFGAGSFSYDLN
jgi:hypothetical protein